MAYIYQEGSAFWAPRITFDSKTGEWKVTTENLISGGTDQLIGGNSPEEVMKEFAQLMRSDLNIPVNECPFTHSHTKHWCGYEGCREG